jgi:hypothetical protein
MTLRADLAAVLRIAIPIMLGWEVIAAVLAWTTFGSGVPQWYGAERVRHRCHLMRLGRSTRDFEDW